MEDLNASADFLERTSAATMRQLGICIAVLFIVLAVNVNYYVNWSQAYDEHDRAALLVLNQLYPEAGGKDMLPSYHGLPLTGSINQRSKTYLGLVDKELQKETDPTDQALLRRHIEFWKSGFAHLTLELSPYYDLNTPEQRKAVRSVLEDDLKEESQAGREARTFQLPLLGISFDSRNRAFVLGSAMLVVLAGLVFALRREILVTGAILESHGEAEEAHKLCFRQFIYQPDHVRFSRRVRIDTLRGTVLVPVMLQLLMAWELWQDRWLADTDKAGYQWMLGAGVVLAVLLGLLATYTQALLTRLWMAWEAAVTRSDGVMG